MHGDALTAARVSELLFAFAEVHALRRLAIDDVARTERGAEAARVLFRFDQAPRERFLAAVPVLALSTGGRGDVVLTWAKAYTHQLEELVRVAVALRDEVAEARAQLADDLAALASPALQGDVGWLERGRQRILSGGVARRAREAEARGEAPKAVDLVTPHLAAATSELHAVYARAVLLDARADLWAAVALAQKHARLAQGDVEALPERDRASVDAIAAANPALLAQEAATDRADALMQQHDSKAALAPLFAAYPGTKPHGGVPRFASEPWAMMPPTGTPRYALAVATAMRSNVIRWYNAAQSRASGWEAGPNRMTASHMLVLCDHWAVHARAAASDPSLWKSIDELRATLRADQHAVMQ